MRVWSEFVRRRLLRIAGQRRQLVRMFAVLVMAEMLSRPARLVSAIGADRDPAELEHDDRHHEEKEFAGHGTEYSIAAQRALTIHAYLTIIH